MKKFLIIALFASGAWAIEQPRFSDFDLNSDGMITQGELKEGKQLKNTAESHTFAEIDSNHDGSISEKEFLLHKTIYHTQACITFG